MSEPSVSIQSLSRRRLGLACVASALGALGLASCATPAPRSRVRIGLMTYSLRDRSFDAAIAAMQQLGFREFELYSPHIELGGVSAHRKMWQIDPAPAAERAALRDRLRQWRHAVPLSYFESIGARTRAAGLAISAYTLSFRDDFDDMEIDRGFQMARALGASAINASATLSVLPRVAAYAERYQIRVGVHNHAGLADENEIETPGSIERALAVSRWIGLNLDIGHCHAAGFDVVRMLETHRARITTLHLKDRLANDGPNVPFGAGSTPLREVLNTMLRIALPCPANIEYEYRSAQDATVEIARSLRYCEQLLA